VFLDQLVQRNPDLARVAVELHQRGDLPASSYVIDLDVLSENAVALCKEARRLGVSVLAMTKQFGRNPVAMQTLERAGVETFVAVDMRCAGAIERAGAKIGHLGHLVQIPRHEAARAAAMEPEYWTVFDVQKAKEAGSAARSLGREQAILARVFAAGDVMFESHAGGFQADEVERFAAVLAAIDGCRLAGVSTYPALAFNRESRRVEATPNLATVAAVAAKLEKLGYGRMEVNAPGVTSTAVLSMLAEAGATQVEPGHGFTGTTPLHAVAELVERPAMVYVSEVSHLSGDSAFCFGGGLYQCIDTIPGRLEALVGAGPEEALAQRAVAHLTDYQVIDFYGRLTPGEGTAMRPGDSVVFCFRPQVFYTRAYVAPVSGIASGEPRVEGIYDSQGIAL
jgi:predicted amino acid racemase